jgi:hypothetical protein
MVPVPRGALPIGRFEARRRVRRRFRKRHEHDGCSAEASILNGSATLDARKITGAEQSSASLKRRVGSAKTRCAKSLAGCAMAVPEV